MSLKETLLGVLGDAFTQACVVTEVQQVSAHFRTIELEAPSFAHAHLTHADKIQLDVGQWVIRTYTPFASAGSRLKVLAFAHGDTPSARWARATKAGDRTHALGPKAVLKLKDDTRPLLLFGDETSFATLLRMRSHFRAAEHAVGVFEVTSLQESRAALASLGVKDAVLVEKTAGNGHHDTLREMLIGAAVRRRVVLTGNAQSIQKMLRALKDNGVPASATSVKPYWSVGKVGLD